MVKIVLRFATSAKQRTNVTQTVPGNVQNIDMVINVNITVVK